ncbi:deaminase domain-containing protein [Runella sp.]|uniref:deaminase domain-containing protein n=1 Tax=Runella sp. TaxID=1960881 RepID=UPI003D0C5B20
MYLAIVAWHLAWKQNKETLLPSLLNNLNFLGLSSSAKILLTPSVGKYVKLLALADISKSVVDIGLADANVQRRLNATAEGKSFLAVWPFVSAGLDIATLTSEQILGFIQSHKATAAILRQEGKIEAADKLEQMEDFVNTSGRQTWNGFANIFQANADEIAEATARIKNYRTTNNLSGKNCGYIEGNVNGTIVNNKIWLSGPANIQLEPQIFTAIEVEGGGGRSWLRNTDSEYKMLNKLASDLGGTSGAVLKTATGEIKIVSELPYCLSCQGIIQQFNEMFPNIKLILVDGAK